MVILVFSLFFAGFFKELDFKELEIHRYSLMDIHQWIFIDGYPSMNSLMDTINESIDGSSMNMVPFFWAPSLGPFFGTFLIGWNKGRMPCSEPQTQSATAI